MDNILPWAIFLHVTSAIRLPQVDRGAKLWDNAQGIEGSYLCLAISWGEKS